MKKLTSLLLMVSLLLSLGAFTGALAEETPEITWLMSGTGTTSDENNLVLQEIEKRIGVRVRPIQTAPGDFDARLNTMIASRTLPDLFSIGVADAQEFIGEGMLLPLDDLLAAHGPHILAATGDTLKKAPANQLDGQTYMINSGRVDYVENLAVRVDWLKNLNLEMPTTLDELYDVLYAFTCNDPDGNGRDDTVGIVTTMTQGNQWQALFGAFGIGYERNYLTQDGTVTTYMKAEHYLDCVNYLRKLYQNGVMDREFATMPAMTAHEALWTGRCGVYGFRSVGTTNNWYPGRYTFETPADPAEVFGYTVIEGPDGHKGVPRTYPNLNGGFVVASTCKNPEAVIRFLDFLYTEEGDELTYLGVEDVMFAWTDKENGKYRRMPGYEDDAAHRAAGGFTYWMGCIENNAELRTMNALTQQAQALGRETAFDWPQLNVALEADAEYGSTLAEITREALAQLIVTTGDVEAEYKAFVARWEEEGGLEWEEQATAAWQAARQ